MRSVLVDMHLAESMIHMNPQDYSSNEEKKALYRSVFDKYGLTEAEYDSSLIWYGKNLDLYMRIYNLALSDVKQQIEAMGDVKPEAVSTSDQDSTDIWMYQRYYEFSPFALSNIIVFDFKPEREYVSGSAFVLGFCVWGIIPKMEQSIELYLRADQNDTTIMVKDVISENGYHEMLIRTLPTKKVKRLYGHIRLNEKNQSPYYKIYLDDFRLTRFNYGSAYIEHLDTTLYKSQDVN